MKVFSSLQRQELKPVKSTQMNQEFEDWLTLRITIGPCLLLHINRKVKEECDKDTACVKAEIPLTWDPVASGAWASLRMHLLSRRSYFMAQLYVYWLRDPTVTFQICVGPDNWSDLSNYNWLEPASHACCCDTNGETTKSWKRSEVQNLKDTA